MMFRMNNRLQVALVASLAATIAFSAVPVFASVTLPLPDPPENSLVFGDMTVFSMSFLQFQYDLANGNALSQNPTNGDPFFKASSPGQIKDDLVIFTFPAAARGNPSSVDDAYPIPNEGSANFSTVTEPDPTKAGDPTPDYANTWDANTSAVRTFLGDDNMVFWFNLNEEANEAAGIGLNTQDILGWIRITLLDTDTGAAPLDFFLAGNPDLNPAPPDTSQDGKDASAAALATARGVSSDPDNWAAAGPDELDATGTGDVEASRDVRWTYVHGFITVDATTGDLIHLGPEGSIPGFDYTDLDPLTLTQNLGANNSAFALFNEDLNNEVKDPTSPYDLITVDARMARTGNGFEQLYIQATAFVPEPSTFVVWSILAALGISIGWCRRRKAA